MGRKICHCKNHLKNNHVHRQVTCIDTFDMHIEQNVHLYVCLVLDLCSLTKSCFFAISVENFIDFWTFGYRHTFLSMFVFVHCFVSLFICYRDEHKIKLYLRKNFAILSCFVVLDCSLCSFVRVAKQNSEEFMGSLFFWGFFCIFSGLFNVFYNNASICIQLICFCMNFSSLQAHDHKSALPATG